MKFTKTIICLTLVVLVTCRALEEDEQTIGWGKAAVAEEDLDTVGLNMVKEEQSLGLGLEEDSMERPGMMV